MVENSKKRILYVDGSSCDEMFNNRKFGVLVNLRKIYDVEPHLDLNLRVVDLLAGTLANGVAYDALLTHVPFSRDISVFSLPPMDKTAFYECAYGDSLDILKKIRLDFPKMPIVAYTGADNVAELKDLVLQSVNEIVFKSGSVDNDSRLIESALVRLLESIK